MTSEQKRCNKQSGITPKKVKLQYNCGSSLKDDVRVRQLCLELHLLELDTDRIVDQGGLQDSKMRLMRILKWSWIFLMPGQAANLKIPGPNFTVISV